MLNISESSKLIAVPASDFAPESVRFIVAKYMGGRLKPAFSATVKAFRILFLEILGAFFIFLSVAGFASSLAEYQKYIHKPAAGTLRLGLTVLFAMAMLFSGLHSFWKARKIRQ